jgi:hypothetical protein
MVGAVGLGDWGRWTQRSDGIDPVSRPTDERIDARWYVGFSRSPLAALVDVDELAGVEGLTISARRDTSDTHWPDVFWVDPNFARLTCTCGVVDTEPVVLRHMLAFEAAEERLLHRHACSGPAVGGPYDADFMHTEI